MIIPAWPSFHTLRHTCASLLFEAGKNVKQVQEWLGHAGPGFTLRTYVHLLDGGLGEADFLDAAVTPDPARVNPGYLDTVPYEREARSGKPDTPTPR